MEINPCNCYCCPSSQGHFRPFQSIKDNMSHITQLGIYKKQYEAPSFSFSPFNGLMFLLGKADSQKPKMEIKSSGSQMSAHYVEPLKDPMVKVLRAGVLVAISVSTLRYIHAHKTGEIKSVKQLYKERFGKDYALWEPFDIHGPGGEEIQMERNWRDERNREAYDRVQEGTASEKDYERATEWERDHIV